MLIIIPTDTCYGLAGDISSLEDYHEIYRLKGRNFDKRLAILVKDWDMLCKYSEITRDQIGFLENYPHPWSIILSKKEGIVLPEYLDAEQYTHISFRVASACIPIDIGNKLSYPLWLTSANLSGQSESQTLAEVISCFPGIDCFNGGLCDQPPSDVFSLGAYGELQYVRQNY